MAVRTFLAAIAVMFLSSCSSIDGRYRPACIAYEGDEIEFSESRFIWRRFTDELKVDENGELIEPFHGGEKGRAPADDISAAGAQASPRPALRRLLGRRRLRLPRRRPSTPARPGPLRPSGNPARLSPPPME